MSLAWGHKIIAELKSLKRDAVIESGKLMFSLIGIGTVMANIVVAGKLFFLPVIVVFLAAWYAVYRQMEGVN